jgi:hypothetical protein
MGKLDAIDRSRLDADPRHACTGTQDLPPALEKTAVTSPAPDTSSESASPAETNTAQRRNRKSSVATILIVLILTGSFALKLRHLGHTDIKPLDEVFHAIVARNFLKHPFTPTLNDPQFVPNGDKSWLDAHIWLHKPPMAMWQMALSFAAFGVNAWAMRLPSALLSTAAVWLTYLIARRLVDDCTGLIAATLQAFSPPILMLVHGYVFSDHVDIALLFWFELAVYLLIRTIEGGGRNDAIACGVAGGLAFLSKSYPALMILVLVAAGWALTRWRYTRDGWEAGGASDRQGEAPLEPCYRKEEARREPRAPGTSDASRGRMPNNAAWIVCGAMLATLAPWMMWSWMNWPAQFVRENFQQLSHVTGDVENWAAPWDRLVFDFAIRIFHVFYPLAIAAQIALLIRARRNPWLWLIASWFLGVFVPFSLVTSKTMTATLIGWPAVWIAIGWLISRALKGDALALGVWLIAMLSAVILIRTVQIPTIGWGYPEQRGFGVIMRQNSWVIWHVLGALAGGAIVARIVTKAWARRTGVGIAAAAMVVLMLRFWPGPFPRGPAILAWKVTSLNKEDASMLAIANIAGKLPEQAAFLVEDQSRLENKQIQFYADRTCYSLRKRDDWKAGAQAVVDGDGLPYVISSHELPLPVVYQDRDTGRTIYACTPKAKSVALTALHEIRGESN